ncbi:713_t:CDS:2, partial [Gigaspora rosea]
KKQIALIIGRFAIEKDKLNITMSQYVPLNVSSNPQSMIFRFTGPIQNPAVIENGQGIFRLKRDVYNGVTGNQSSLSVPSSQQTHQC